MLGAGEGRLKQHTLLLLLLLLLLLGQGICVVCETVNNGL